MTFGPIQFEHPVWLALALVLCPLAWLIARRSLTGLHTITRRTALALRYLVIVAISVALAEPSWRTPSEDLTLMVVLDESASMPPGAIESVRNYIESAAATSQSGDRLGVVTAAEDAFVQQLPSRLNREIIIDYVGGREGTDLAAALRMGVAVLPRDTAGRIAVFTDGNETQGSLLSAAQAARAANIPIDVLPVGYDFESEVILERLIAPPAAREGQPISVRFVLTATRPTRGAVRLSINDAPYDLDPDSPDLSAPVELEKGTNVITVPIIAGRPGAQRFDGVFEPETPDDDAIPLNNQASAVTFIGGEGRVLVYADDVEASIDLVRALERSAFEVEVRSSTDVHGSLIELGSYDAIVLVDISSYAFSRRQQEELRAYVHDLGGGLVVVGGPNSYGAGGWIGSPLADALPVKLDPPAKRQMPRGALALIMHSCEMPRGNYWGKVTAQAAVDTLSRLDLVGVLEYDWGANGSHWAYKLAPKGDGVEVHRAIENLVFGDMPDFASAMALALRDLQAAKAGQKHCIIISDGDPSPPSQQLLSQFSEAGITISTVAVFPHSFGANSPDVARMRDIARATGGKAYEVLKAGQVGTLPQIFTKEAQTIRRSLIWEGDPFQPEFINMGAESLRGLGGAFPSISGYIVTAEREGLSIVSLKGQEGDPIHAQWQYGLGRVIAFTSDAATRWSADWVNWTGYNAFWEQQLRWAMRPTGSANVRINTRTDGDDTIVSIDAVTAEGEPLNFAQFSARTVAPDGGSAALELRQIGAGRYEGSMRTDESGSYLINVRYNASVAGADGAPRLERGAVQAAVTKPISDEHRDLTDNAPLLIDAARRTNGRVLDPDPVAADLFSREGLNMPVALQSVWLLIATIALGIFLTDVAVRRVRIDIGAMRSSMRKALSKREKATESQIEALRAAKQATQSRVEQAQAPGVEAPRPDSTKSVKFEAPGDSSPGEVLSKPVAEAPPLAPAKEEQSDDEDGGMSRLMKAKQRARDTMRRDNDPDQKQ